MPLSGKSQERGDREAMRLTTAIQLILIEPGWKIKETAASSWDMQEPLSIKYDARWKLI